MALVYSLLEKGPRARGESTATNVNVHFLKNGNVTSINLLGNTNLAQNVRRQMRLINHDPRDNMFAASYSLPLSESNMKTLKKKAYVVAPKPLGVRYLLYVDPEGRMFMQNSTQHIFQLDRDRAPLLIPKDTVLDGIVVRKIVRAQDSNQEGDGKLTFVIMDATRCNGLDLTQSSIQERIWVAKTEIIQPRLKVVRTDREVFDLDIAQYEELSHLEEYLSQGFKDSYGYPLGSFIFHPLVRPYVCGKLNRSKPIFEWDESDNQECTFRLKIAAEEGSQHMGDLYAVGKRGAEAKYATIDLTDELRTKNGCIIECRLVDNHWDLIRVRNDCGHPNVRLSRYGTFKAPLIREIVLGRVLTSLKNRMDTD